MAPRKCIKNDTVELLFYALNPRIKRSQRAAEPEQDFYVIVRGPLYFVRCHVLNSEKGFQVSVLWFKGSEAN
jgi:hypothetical protein